MRRNDYLTLLHGDIARWEAQAAIWRACAAGSPAQLAPQYLRQLDLVDNTLRCARATFAQMQSAPEGAWPYVEADAASSRRELRGAFERVRRRVEGIENHRRAA